MDMPVVEQGAVPPPVFDGYMPTPPVCTSDEQFPGWDALRVCLYRLPPARVTLPASQTLRIGTQLSSRSMRVERDLGGTVSVAQHGLDTININPAFQVINWQWDDLMEFVHIQLSPALLRRMESEHGISVERLLRIERFSVHDAMIAQIGHEFADMLEGRHPRAGVEYLDALATFLVLHLWNRYGDPAREGQRQGKTRGPDFHRIVDYIHNNLDQDLRLEQIARMSNLSTFYFIRLFKAAFGKTPHQYILECRIGLAKDLLKGSYLPISEISQRCGFSTQSHFTSAFRQATGHSPRAYRQSHAAPGEQPAH